MAKTDYKAYLQSIQVGEVDPIKRIKNYLEELSQRDEALKTLYRPEKINDCYNFIRECVKSIGKGNAYCIEDAVVFKMARDYFIDILPKEADEPPEVKAQAQAEETAEAEETEAETPPENTGVDTENSGSSNPRESEEAEKTEAMPQAQQGGIKTDEYGFEVFDGEPEQDAQTCGAVETKAETEPEKADNENEGSSNPREAEPQESASDPVHYDENGNGLLFDFE
jgi:hypothetical protein